MNFIKTLATTLGLVSLVALSASPAAVQKGPNKKFGVGMVPHMNEGDDTEKGLHQFVGNMAEIDRMYNINDSMHMLKTLDNLKRAGKKIDFLVIGGHGSRDTPGIKFAKDDMIPEEVDIEWNREHLRRAKQMLSNPDNALQSPEKLRQIVTETSARLKYLETVADAMDKDAIVILINCSAAATEEGQNFVRSFGRTLLGKRGGHIVASKSDIELNQRNSVLQRLWTRVLNSEWMSPGDILVQAEWVTFPIKPGKEDAPKAKDSIGGWWLWVRPGKDAKGRAIVDRVPVFLTPQQNGDFNGVYFPYLTMKTLRMTPNLSPTTIRFPKASGNTYHYTWRYPNGPRGTGTMTWSGRTMRGDWIEDRTNNSGKWTWERPTAAELARLVKHFGRPDQR